MSQHVRVRLERQFGRTASPFNHASKASGGERCAAFAGEGEGQLRLLLTLKAAQCPKLIPPDRMRTRCAMLDPADVQGGLSEVNLIPPQVY
jgi:hypothetical protein